MIVIVQFQMLDQLVDPFGEGAICTSGNPCPFFVA
jgi:hypothetical protein